MSLQYRDAQGNHYVRGVGQPDFTDAEKKELGIGEFREEVDPSRITQGKFQMPGLGNRGERKITYYDDNWNAGGSGRTNPEDWIMDGPAPGSGYADVQPDPTFTWEDWLNQQLPSKLPRPEGLQRVATGVADWLTGNKWDFDQRGKAWKDAVVFGSTGAAGGNTLAQDIVGGNPVGFGSSPEALNFLQKVGSKLGNMLPNVMPDNINPATGNDPNYDALPSGAKERFNNMIEGKESPIQVGW